MRTERSEFSVLSSSTFFFSFSSLLYTAVAFKLFHVAAHYKTFKKIRGTLAEKNKAEAAVTLRKNKKIAILFLIPTLNLIQTLTLALILALILTL